MSDAEATPAEGKKPKRPAEKALEKLFRTLEEAKLEVPADAKKLKPYKLTCASGEAFVVAPNENAALAVFARQGLKVEVSAEGKKPRRSKSPSVKKRLDELLAKAESGDSTQSPQEVVAQLKSIRDELDAARQRRIDAKNAKTDAAASTSAPPVPPS